MLSRIFAAPILHFLYWLFSIGEASVIEGFARFSVCFKVFLVMLRYTEAILLYECWNKMGS